MKRGFFIVLISLMASQLVAQAPLGFNYQGIARGADGTPIAGKEIAIRVSIIDGPQGNSQFSEEHFLITNDFGLFTAVIGNGNGNSTLNSVDWSLGNLWLQIELDPDNSGYILMGSQQLMSVPYALFAQQSGEGLTSGYGIDVNNGTISNILPDRPISLTGVGDIEVKGSYPIFTIENTGNVDDDFDSTNEIQDLSLNTNSLDLTSGGSVDLSGYLDNTDNQNLSNVLGINNSAGNNKIIDLASPTLAQDATTKNYVDTQDTGLQGAVNSEVTNRTNADTGIQAELDASQTGAGLDADGNYTADVATNYIKTASNLQNADKLLDEEIKSNNSNISILTSRLDNTYAFSTEYSFINSTGAVFVNEVVDISTSINFDTFPLIVGNQIQIKEDGIYVFNISGKSQNINQVSLRISGSIIYKVSKQDDRVDNASWNNDLGQFLIPLTVGDYLEIIIESSNVIGETFNGTFFGYKI